MRIFKSCLFKLDNVGFINGYLFILFDLDSEITSIFEYKLILVG